MTRVPVVPELNTYPQIALFLRITQEMLLPLLMNILHVLLTIPKKVPPVQKVTHIYIL